MIDNILLKGFSVVFCVEIVSLYFIKKHWKMGPNSYRRLLLLYLFPSVIIAPAGTSGIILVKERKNINSVYHQEKSQP